MQCNAIFRALKKLWPSKVNETSDNVEESFYVEAVDTNTSEFENLPRYGDTIITVGNIDKYIDSKRLSRLNKVNSAFGLFDSGVLARLNKYRSQYADDINSGYAIKKLAYTHIYEQYRTAVHLLRMIPHPNKNGAMNIDIVQLHEITSSEVAFMEYTKHCLHYMLKHFEIDVDNVMAALSGYIHNSMNVSQRQAVRDKHLNVFNRTQYFKRELLKAMGEIENYVLQKGVQSYDNDYLSSNYTLIWSFIGVMYWTYVENDRIKLNKRLDTIKNIVISSEYIKARAGNGDFDPDDYFHTGTIYGGVSKFYNRYRDIVFKTMDETVEE